jgi:hypothetical protein
MNEKQYNICKIPNSKKSYKISNLKKERIYLDPCVYNDCVTIYEDSKNKTLQFNYKTSNVINVVIEFNLKKRKLYG